MSRVALVPIPSLPTGWTVHVEVELARTSADDGLTDGPDLSLLSRTARGGAAVTLLGDVAMVTWRTLREGAVTDAGQALAHAVDATLQLLTPLVSVQRVRRAWTETGGPPGPPRQRPGPGPPRQPRPVQRP